MPRHSSDSWTARASRHVAPHPASSASNSLAKPGEDWTKISDLAERRRIQNRIAQRNYRRKLKERLEDLEGRAGSSLVLPPQVHAKTQHQERENMQQSPENQKDSMFERTLPVFNFTQYLGSEDYPYRSRSQSPLHLRVSTAGDRWSYTRRESNLSPFSFSPQVQPPMNPNGCDDSYPDAAFQGIAKS